MTRGLTIIVAEASEPRLRSALVTALATRALDGRCRLFLDAAAVAALSALSGGLSVLVDDALTAGVVVIVCQTGLAQAGLTADLLDPRFGYGGMVSVLAELGEDRLVVI